LSLVEALWFVKVLRGMNIDVYPILERYKLPGVTSENARNTAHDIILVRRVQMPDTTLQMWLK
jgi:hypothetical protein